MFKDGHNTYVVYHPDNLTQYGYRLSGIGFDEGNLERDKKLFPENKGMIFQFIKINKENPIDRLLSIQRIGVKQPTTFPDCIDFRDIYLWDEIEQSLHIRCTHWVTNVWYELANKEKTDESLF